MQTLEGKVALVTGGARGIGAAIAERLAADGATVAINYSMSATEAADVVARIRARGGHAATFQADVSHPDQAQALVDATIQAFGRIDILVNNAGIADLAPIGLVDEAHVRSQFALNVDGPVFTTKAAAARFPAEGGRVITVNAVAPGLVDTDMLRRSGLDDGSRQAMIARTPLGRLGTPSDVADTVAFLASPDARWITGQVIETSGGINP